MGATTTQATGIKLRVTSSLPASADLLTVCGWFYLSSLPGAGAYPVLWSFDTASAGSAIQLVQIAASNDGSPYTLIFYSNGTFLQGSTTLAASTWYFWAVTRASGAAHVYLKPLGGSWSHEINQATGVTSGGTPDEFVIGADTSFAGDPCIAGTYSWHRAWNATLTEAQLQAEAASGKDPALATNLYAKWYLAAGARTTDSSGNGHTLTEVGTVTDGADPWLIVNVSQASGVTESATVTLASTTLSISVSDTIGSAESATEAVGTSQVGVSDSSSVAESATVILPAGATLTPNVSEAIGAADGITTAAQVAAPPVSVIDSIATAESATVAVGAAQVNVSQPVNSAESAAASLVTTINVSQGATLAESASLDISGLARLITVSDNIAVIEPPFAVSDIPEITVSDSVATAESTAETISTAQIAAVENAFVGETPNLSAGGLPTETINLEEDITVSDSTSVVTSDPQIYANDTLGALAESAVATDAAPQIAVSDSASLTENAATVVLAAGTFSVTVSDTASLNENATAVVSSAGALTVGVFDTAGTTDSATATVSDPQASAGEAISLSENTALLVVPLNTSAVSVSEPVGTAESVTLAISTAQISVSETLVVTDSGFAYVLADLFIVTTETISVAEMEMNLLYIAIVALTLWTSHQDLTVMHWDEGMTPFDLPLALTTRP